MVASISRKCAKNDKKAFYLSTIHPIFQQTPYL